MTADREDPTPTVNTVWDEPKLSPAAVAGLIEPPLVAIKQRWVIAVVVVGALGVCGSVVYAMATHGTPKARAERDLGEPRVFGTATGRVPESIRKLEVATPTAPPRDVPADVANTVPGVKTVDYGDQQTAALLKDQAPILSDQDYAAKRWPNLALNTPIPDATGAPPKRHQTGDCCGDGELPPIFGPEPKDGQEGGLQAVSSAPAPVPWSPTMPSGGPQLGQLAEALAGGEDDDAKKEAFASRGGIDTLGSDEADLAECDVSAGRPVAGNVLVATNSDIPAKNTVTITVSQTVYCGADREHVAIPQGSKFVGSVDSRVVYGQERTQLCMHQLERPPSAGHPKGSRKQLGCFVVADITGQTGMPAEVNNHWGQLIGGAILSTILSLGVSAPAGNQQGFAPTLAQGAARNASANISQVGQKVVQREMQRKPTLETQMLEGVLVIFTSNLELEPWKGRGRR